MRYVKTVVFLVLTLYILVGACPVYAGEKQSFYSGSGFFITPNVVVTSNHVVKGASRIEVVYNNEAKLTGTVIGYDDASDLALLRVSGVEFLVGQLVLANSSRMRQGDRIYVVGFPLPFLMGLQPKISEGLISGTAGLQGDLRMYQISAPVQPGNSGGPLLNEQAEVVGVVSASLNAVKMMEQGIAPQNVNFAVKSNNIFNLLNYYRLDVNLNAPENNDRILSAADIMDIARKAVVYITVIK